MSPAARAPQAPPFEKSLKWSAGLHAILLGLALLLPHLRFLFDPPFEIEIISPFLGNGPARLGAPKPLVTGVMPQVRATSEAAPKPVEKAPQPPQDWVLPGPKTKVLETPAPPAAPGGEAGGTGTASKVGGSGAGSDEGVAGGTGDGGSGQVR